MRTWSHLQRYLKTWDKLSVHAQWFRYMVKGSIGANLVDNNPEWTTIAGMPFVSGAAGRGGRQAPSVTLIDFEGSQSGDGFVAPHRLLCFSRSMFRAPRLVPCLVVLFDELDKPRRASDIFLRVGRLG